MPSGSARARTVTRADEEREPDERRTTPPADRGCAQRRLRPRRGPPRPGPCRRHRRPARAVREPRPSAARRPDGRPDREGRQAGREAGRRTVHTLHPGHPGLPRRPTSRSATTPTASSPASARPAPSNLVLGVQPRRWPCSASASARCTGPRRSCPTTRSSRMRHPQRATDANRAGFVDTMSKGGQTSQLTRRPLIKVTLGARDGPVRPAPPAPARRVASARCRRTSCRSPSGTARRTRRQDPLQDAAPHARPREHRHQGQRRHDRLGVPRPCPRACSDLDRQRHLSWRPRPRPPCSSCGSTRATSSPRRSSTGATTGIVAYSKICTHVGCPVGLYEQQTHHLLCPCHQSTFDVTQDCKVIFGPAKRPLPQLKITVDADGYLVATQPFREAVGPSFWERGHMSASTTSRPADALRADDGRAHGAPRQGCPEGRRRRRLDRRPHRRRRRRRTTCSRRSSPTTGRSCSARSPCTR